MAIIVKNGKSNTEDAVPNGKFSFFDRSSTIKKSSKSLFQGKYTIVPGEGLFIPKYFEGPFDLHQRAYCLTSTNETSILNKFLFYYIFKNQKIFNNFSVGSTVPSLRISSFNWIKNATFPNFETQQQIIDIIEPIENMQFLTFKLIKLILDFSLLISVNDVSNSKKELMKKSCFFERGKSVKNFEKGKTNFLNVAAANGNYNKKCNEHQNVFPGDVTLSLDGSVGLVNNFLNGFNGYLYKVYSKIHPNWKIYFSLKMPENKKIMVENETGTTIKHSSNSKNLLLFFPFEASPVLELLFKLDIILKKQLEVLKEVHRKAINLLVIN